MRVCTPDPGAPPPGPRPYASQVSLVCVSRLPRAATRLFRKKNHSPGYEDPLLLLAAKNLYPTAWKLMPWVYTPQLALAFANQSAPMDFFEAATGQAMQATELSFKSTDIGAYLPMVQQKAMATGLAANSTPQWVRSCGEAAPGRRGNCGRLAGHGCAFRLPAASRRPFPPPVGTQPPAPRHAPPPRKTNADLTVPGGALCSLLLWPAQHDRHQRRARHPGLQQRRHAALHF